jgi:hypothetical protein
VIAFAATVFGILVGGFAYAAGLVRRAWYEQDLSDLEFVAGLLADVGITQRTECASSLHDRGLLARPTELPRRDGDDANSPITQQEPRHA